LTPGGALGLDLEFGGARKEMAERWGDRPTPIPTESANGS